MRTDGLFERYASFDELRSVCAAPDGAWLSEAERRELNRFRDPTRRRAWLCGRRLGKQLVLETIAESETEKLKVESSGLWVKNKSGSQLSTVNSQPLEQIRVEICSRDAAGRAVRPTVKINGRRSSCCLSISHSERGILLAVSTNPGISVGVDLATSAKLKPAFLKTWFTGKEQQWQQNTNSQLSMTLWAIKEAVYKACNAGESFKPRRIEVFRSRWGRFWCRYEGKDLRDVCDIRTRKVDGQMAVTVVAKSIGTDDRTDEIESLAGHGVLLSNAPQPVYV